MVQVKVRQGTAVHCVDIQPEDTVDKLNKQLESLTGIFARKQKLIFKGKVLLTDMKLDRVHGLKEGSVIMLVAAAGQLTQVSSCVANGDMGR